MGNNVQYDEVNRAISLLEKSGYSVIKKSFGMSESERKLCFSVGEFIHSIGNIIKDKCLVIPHITVDDGFVLHDMGEAIRGNMLTDYPRLLSAGIDTREMSRADLVDKAHDILFKAHFLPPHHWDSVRRIELKAILELPENDATESQVKEWLMLNLGWACDLDDMHPLKHVKLVAENPDSIEVTTL